MTTNQTQENIANTTTVGLRAILKIGEFKKSILTAWSSIIATTAALLFLISCSVLKIEIYPLLIEIKNNIINFLPNILGFTVAGYALVVGFIQTDLLERITEREENSPYSLYQKMSSIFAINILLQGFSLLIAYLFHYINYLDLNNKLNFSFSPYYIAFTNWIGLTIITFCLTFSLLMVLQIVINIFNFSQLHHYLINKSKLDRESKQ